MGIIKLVINEVTKIFSKKSTIVFIVLSILSLFLAYGLVSFQKSIEMDPNRYATFYKQDLERNIKVLNKQLEDATDEETDKLNSKLEVYQYAYDNDISMSTEAGYRGNILNNLIKENDILDSINQKNDKKDYSLQKEKVDKLWNILKNGTFEEYVAYENEQIEKDYNAKLISKEEYDEKIYKNNLNLKYEINKEQKKSLMSSWKETAMYYDLNVSTKIKEKFDSKNQVYLNETQVRELENQKLINLYRLDNNKQYGGVLDFSGDTEAYFRHSYDDLSLYCSMFFVTLLFIILAASSVSEEVSKGTIKFLLITPFKRYKILLAKIIAYLVLLTVLAILISQINVLLGNIFFPGTVNDYLYVQNNTVEVMNTSMYSMVKYLFKLPEVIIYVLLGISLSTLTRNTALSNTITSVIYIGATSAINVAKQFINLDFLKYLPFTNFDLITKLMPVNTYSETVVFGLKNTTSSGFSITVLTVTAILLIITMFESFNKRDIN